MAKSKAQHLPRFLVDLTAETPASILYVDDESNLLKVTKQCLEMDGCFKVDTALSAEEARKKMAKKAYEVIVSDYMMPGKTGLELLRELRDEGDTTPFIVFTGKGREEVAVKALNLGADQYLNKVGDPEAVYLELAHGINKAIERRRAGNKLRESEERFRNIFENASDAMIYLDQNGRIIDINQKTWEICGGKKKDLIGHHFTKVGILKVRDMPKLLKAFARGISGKHAILNITINNQKDQQITLECSANLLKTAGKSSLLVIARDITKRLQTEEKLKMSEGKYEALLEETPIGICNLDIRGKITYGNRAFAEITGYSRSEFIGKSAFDLARQSLPLTDKKLKPLLNQIRNRLMGRSKSQPTLLPIRRSDGSLRWVEAESKLIKKFRLPTGLQAILRDVTDRKEMEEKLKENEERFRSIVENSHGGIGIIDDSFQVKYVNERAAHILGYSKEEVMGQDFRKFLPKENLSQLQERYLHRQQGKNLPSQYEFEMVRKDGKRITVELNVALFKHNQGRVQTIAEILDITNRKKAFEALQESEEKFRNLAEQLPNMIFINKKGRVVYANEECVKIMGYTIEEFYSSDFNFHSLIAPESIELVKSAFKEHIEGREVASYEYTLLTKDGQRIEVIITTRLIKYEGDTAILGIITDITERKSAEEEIQETQEKFHQLFMGNPEAAVYVDPTYHIKEVNPRFIQLFGYSEKELIHTHVNALIVPEGKRHEAEELDRRSKDGYVYHRSERKRKDGTLVPVAISAAPIIVRNKITGHVALYKDITQLQKTETALKETLEKLQVVGGLTRHDVRNKLAAIAGNIYLAKKRLPCEPEIHELMKDSESAIKQVEEIFNFARAYEKLGVEDLTPTDLGETIEAATSLLQSPCDVKIENCCRGVKVLADSLLRQLFYNLMDNSLKHGKKVTHIRIYCEKSNDETLKLVYEDDGIGVPANEKDRIFKEGYGRGTGHGLYLIQKICEVYGWTVQETGSPDKGAQFVISIDRSK